MKHSYFTTFATSRSLFASASVIHLVEFRNCNLTSIEPKLWQTPLTPPPPPQQSRLTTWTCRWGWKPGRGDDRRCSEPSQIRCRCAASRRLCEFPTRSYSSTSFEDAVKKVEEPPTPPPRPQKSHSRASSLDLNKLFQQGAPGTIHSLFQNESSGKSPGFLLGSAKWQFKVAEKHKQSTRIF